MDERNGDRKVNRFAFFYLLSQTLTYSVPNLIATSTSYPFLSSIKLSSYKWIRGPLLRSYYVVAGGLAFRKLWLSEPLDFLVADGLQVTGNR